MEEAAIVAAFAQKLKSLRLRDSLTLDGLSSLSGVSISAISKIENGQQRPSFETVLRIARALKINFVQLLEPGTEASAHLARRVITRAPEAPVYASAWATYHTHSAELTRKAMIPFVMRIKTHELPPFDEWSIHDGEEFIYVLEGVLEFHTEHYSPAILNPGDSCYLDSTMRHAFVSKGEAEAVLLSICRQSLPEAGPTSNAS